MSLINPEDRKSYSKITQIYNALRQDFTVQNIEKIIIPYKDTINYRIPSHSFIKSSEPALVGGTVLHIALSRRSHEAVKLLLQVGIDYTLKNDSGSTALHYIATSDFQSLSDAEKLSTKPFIDMILSAHVASKNFANPRNNYGLSHLHIACMVNHTAAVKFFLSYGEDVNQAINLYSSCNPGYTTLHFSVRCRATESLKIILDHGANILLRDGKGMTPIDLILEQEMLIHDNLNEGIINLLLERISHEKLIIDDVGLSRFHIACTSQDTSLVESILNNVDNINHSVSANSRTWPGYTGLHFAARCNVNTVKMLLDRGADLEIKDALEVSPFDICLKRYKIKHIHAIVSQKNEWKNILLSDGNIRLTDLLFVMEYLSRLKGLLQTDLVYINAHIPTDSRLWPGYTPLHLAVMFSETHRNTCTDVDSPAEPDLDLIRECLTNGADVTIKGSRGSTPLILAYRQDKIRVVNLLLHCHHVLVNPVDEDNLSHLHIACEAQNEILVENLLTRIGDVNIVYRGNKAVRSIKPGYTPLHIAVAKKNSKIVEILIRHGSDINFADFNGCTPIHETLGVACNRIAKLLFSSPALRVCVVNGVGLSHFHIASMYNDKGIVEELITLGADIDGQIISDKFADNSSLPDKFKGCTALHLAVMYRAEDVIMLLLHHKADILIKSDDGSTPLSKTFNDENRKFLRHFISMLKDDEELQSRMERETGMTMLHLACHTIDIDQVTDLLRKEVNVNAQVNDDSLVWAGCTPLHVLSLKDIECVYKYYVGLHEQNLVISEILLGNGADVTLKNKKGDSPIHESVKLDHYDTRYLRIRQLIHYHADFSVNPMNSKGISHFHLACMVNDVSAVEKFLQCGVDVNLPVDFFSDKYAGCYPIHMGIDSRSSKLFGPACQLETIDLLLSHGADVCAENSHGYSALHYAARAEMGARKEILEKICSAGANMNSVSMYGETPFEILLSTAEVTPEEIRFFVEHNAHINSCNPNNERGYLSMLLSKKQHTNFPTLVFEEMIKSLGIAEIDEMGHTAMHNIVTTVNPNILTEDYIQLFKRLTRLGCDIDDQEKSGRTALHLSAQFGNKEATIALLTSGADVNITDAFNKSAFSYAIEVCRKCDGIATHRHEEVIKALALHIHKMQLLDLDVSQLNANLKNGMNPRIEVEEKFQTEVDVVSLLKIEGTTLVVADFMKETKAVIDYPCLNLRDRNAINEFFDTIDNRDIKQLKGILMIQYRKAITRLQLIDLAVIGLRNLLGFPVPDLCCEVIFKFLKNADLKNLITSANDDM